MKFYNTMSAVKMNAWTQSDYDFYLKDLKKKLSYYLTAQNND